MFIFYAFYVFHAVIILCYWVFLFHFTLPRVHFLSARVGLDSFFSNPWAAHAFQPQLHTISSCYSTPTSVPLSLSLPILQFNSPFLSITILTIRYSPFHCHIYTPSHTFPLPYLPKIPHIQHLPALGSKYSYKVLILLEIWHSQKLAKRGLIF